MDQSRRQAAQVAQSVPRFNMATAGASAAPAQSGASQEAIFGDALMALLKNYQGINQQPFLGQQLAAGEEQIRRAAYTSPDLIGASPALQGAARGAAVNAVSPTIQGAANNNQTFSSQLSNFRDILGFSSDLLANAQTERARQEQVLNDLRMKVIEGGGSPSIIDSGLTYEANLERAAPFLQKATEQNIRSQVVNINGVETLIDLNTGMPIRELGPAAPSYYLDPYTNQWVTRGGGNPNSSTNNDPYTQTQDGITDASVTESGGLNVQTPFGSVQFGEGSVSFRHNNPLNIKYGNFAQGYGAQPGQQAQDGGVFAKFPDEQTGLRAAIDLLRSPSYATLPLEQAMRRWSGNGYGADVAPGLNKPTGQMNGQELQYLVESMKKREGWTPGNSGATTIPTQKPQAGALAIPTTSSISKTASPAAVNSKANLGLTDITRIDLNRKFEDKSGSLQKIEESGTGDALLGAALAEQIPVGDAVALADELKNLLTSGLISQEDADGLVVRAANEGVSAVFPVIRSLTGVTSNDIALVMFSRGLSHDEALALALQDRPSFLQQVKSATTFTTPNEANLVSALAMMRGESSAQERSRLLNLIRKVYPNFTSQIDEFIAPFALVDRGLSKDEDFAYVRALDGLIGSVFPDPETISIGLKIPIIGGRSGSVKIGKRYFSLPTNDELFQGGSEGIRRAVVPIVGSTPLQQAGAGIGALAGGVAGTFLGPFGTAGGAVAGAAAGSRLLPQAYEDIKHSGDAPRRFGKWLFGK